MLASQDSSASMHDSLKLRTAECNLDSCILCRCRATIPDKDTLEQRLNEVMQTKFPDKHGVDIKTDATQEAHARAIKLVQEGRVSGNDLVCTEWHSMQLN